MFLISRFIIGFGLVFANTYAPVLIGELAHPKDRQVITSLYQTSFYIGSIAAAWITFGTFAMPSEWSWRIPSLLQCVPATIQMASIWFLPESPRWLLAKGRREEARAVLVKYHANGNEEDALVQLEFAEMQAVIEAETANKTPWRALIATPGNRRRLLIIVMLGLFSQWSGNGLIS
jgi:MFS family permease